MSYPEAIVYSVSIVCATTLLLLFITFGFSKLADFAYYTWLRKER